jgi:putative membrane protein
MPLQSPKSYLILAIKGFFMGAANVVPGVSGGTMALILGIYEDLLHAIRSFNLRFLRLFVMLKIKEAVSSLAWPFLLPVIVGVLAATLSLAQLLSWLLFTYPIMVWSFFFGLILSSVFSVGRFVKAWRTSAFIAIGLGGVGAYCFFGMIPVATPEASWFLFLCGFLAICAMILPGISGAYILVLLGKYHFTLEAVNNRDIGPLFILTLGAALGLLSFVRVLSWLLKRYHDLTMAVLIGLMLGSLRRIWPWKETMTTFMDSTGKEVPGLQINVVPPQLNAEVVLAFLFASLGFLVVIGLHYWEFKKNQQPPLKPVA